MNKQPDIIYSIWFSIIRSRRSVGDFVKFCKQRVKSGQTIAIEWHGVKIEPNKNEGYMLKIKDLKELINGLQEISENIIFCEKIDIRRGVKIPLKPEIKTAIKSVLEQSLLKKEVKPMQKIIDEIIAECPMETDKGIELTAVNDDYEIKVLDKSFNLIGIEKVKVILEEG